MKFHWTIRWWDLMALLTSVVIAVFVVQFTIVKSGLQGTMVNTAQVVVRIPQPLPEVASQLTAGTDLVNSRQEKIGTIQDVHNVPAQGGAWPMTWSGPEDVVVKADINGDLRLVRDLPGFTKEPAPLRVGVWCLLTTDKVEVSGMITQVLPERGR